MPDEFSAAANRALAAVADGGMLVPSIFWYEIANVLIVNERRNRIGRQQITAAIEMIVGLPHRTSGQDISAIMDVARTRNLTVYDASYLDLAKRAGSPLATLDKRLAKAALSDGVEIISALD